MAMLNRVAISRFLNDFLIKGKSYCAVPSPTPRIGPISGEMSIAPMITAVELTFKPIEAMSVAKIKVHRLTPLNITPRRTASKVFCS